MKQIRTRIVLIVSLLLAQLSFGAGFVFAAELTQRDFTLGSNLPGVITTYTIRFTTATASPIGSIRFLFCTSRFGACITPVGMDTLSSNVNLDNQFGMTSFTYQQPSQGELLLVRAASPELAGTPSFYSFSGIKNPTFSNVSFFVRITTYSTDNGLGAYVDEGAAIASINSSLNVEGITPETLSFCVGIIGNSCSDLTGQLIGFGDLKPTATSSATTVMFASTNAPGGYSITIFGTTLASGTHEIPAMGVQSLNYTNNDASAIGQSQFGTNVVDNTIPNIGSPVAGGGIAGPYGGYGSQNRYRFFSGDTVASAVTATNINKFTNSYVVNISKQQAIGYYTATLSYICTGNF